MKINSLKSRKVQGLAILAADLLFFGLTNPSEASSPMLMVAFLLATLTFYWLANNFYRLIRWYGLPFKHRHRAVLASTGVVMGLIGLQAMGQLGVRDMILFLPFAAIGYFYISYQRANR